jgi:uncharacterized membrane protein (DUF485 family)
MSSKLSSHQILESAEFKELAARKNFISVVLTIAELTVYFGFIFLIAFNKPFLAKKMSGAITWGIPIGVGTIVLSWILTGIYIRWANRKYDAMVEEVKDRIGG